MVNRTRVERGACLTLFVLGLIGATLLAAASGARAAKKPPFATGAYSGKTSQGQTIRFTIKRTKCDLPVKPFTNHEAYCFVGTVSSTKLDSYYPALTEACPSADAKPLTAPLYAASYRLSLSSTGHLTWDVKGLGQVITDNGSDSRLTLKVSGSRATGTIRQTEQIDDNGATILCDSGSVTFTAQRA
jgi:hypothetical protein